MARRKPVRPSRRFAVPIAHVLNSAVWLASANLRSNSPFTFGTDTVSMAANTDSSMSQRIYLAGPDVFLPDASAVGRQKKAICREFGFEGLFPLDQDPALEADPAGIFRSNCNLMRQADIGLFNLTPFRGPSADVGTVFELGFLHGLDKPVHGYTSTRLTYQDRVAFTHGPLRQTGGQLWDTQGLSVEDFGLSDNLMIARAIEDADGEMIVLQDEGPTALAATGAFRACIQALRDRA